MNPLDYSLCDRTVTIYRRQGDRILRQVVDNCYFARQEARTLDALGNRRETTFQMIVPGDRQQIFPGDRVFEGIGPEITFEQWSGFIPVKIANLVEVSYVTPCYWAGEICHVEAGRK